MPAVIPVQIHARSFVNGTQLLITAVMEITSNNTYITIRFSMAVNGCMRLTQVTSSVTPSANGHALPNAFSKKLP